MEFIRDANTRAFGTRLRRLSERIDREVQEIYRTAGVEFEPRWFAVIASLKEGGPATVAELAARIGTTHAAVTQVRSALSAQGLITSRADARDPSRQVLALTPAGIGKVSALQSLWAAIAAATEDLLATAAPDLLANIDALEAGLTEKGLVQRVTARLAEAPAER